MEIVRASCSSHKIYILAYYLQFGKLQPNTNLHLYLLCKLALIWMTNQIIHDPEMLVINTQGGGGGLGVSDLEVKFWYSAHRLILNVTILSCTTVRFNKHDSISSSFTPSNSSQVFSFLFEGSHYPYSTLSIYINIHIIFKF